MPNVVKSFEFEVKAAEGDEPIVEITASTGDIDRDDEIVLPSAFEKWLPTYMENPIFLWGHATRDKEAGPDRILGRCESVAVVDGKLKIRVRYAVAENPMALLCYNLVKSGFLKAVSIGFLAHACVSCWEDPADMLSIPDLPRAALQTGAAYRVYTEVEIVEISHVFVGSNRQSLVDAAARGLAPADLVGKALRDSSRLAKTAPDPGPPEKISEETQQKGADPVVEPAPVGADPAVDLDEEDSPEFQALTDELCELFAELLEQEICELLLAEMA